MKTTETSPIFIGTQINYYFVCQRKLWLFSHNLTMEHTSDTVYMDERFCGCEEDGAFGIMKRLIYD